MSEDFLVLALPPRDGAELPSAQFEAVVQALGSAAQGMRHFVVPALRVGTLDALMEASDELAKLDPALEGTVQKLITLMEEVSSRPRAVVTTFRINQTQEMSPAGYIRNFMWSTAQFDVRESVLSIVGKLRAIAGGAEEHVRAMLSQYNETRNKLTTASRKSEGNLSVRPIRDLVERYNAEHHAFVDTELLTTVFVAVPAPQQREWLDAYWHMSDYVCPQSNRVIAEDGEYVLNSVVLFRKVLDDFRAACRKRRLHVRETVNCDDVGGEELQALQSKAERERKALYTLLWQQYCVCYVAWVHLKAVRVFVESVLRYGLPPRFVAVVVQVTPSKEAELRKRLTQLYPDLGEPLESEATPDAYALQHEYPYVSLRIANVQR